MLKKTLLAILIASLLITPLAVFVHAEESEDSDENGAEEILEKIEEYEEKLDDLGSQSQSLQKEIDTINTQVNITELQIQNSIKNIEKKEREIAKLTGDIKDISIRIDQLVERIAYQENVLKERIRERYKARETSPVMVIFGTSTVNDLVKKSTYLKVMEIQDNKVISQMQDTKATYKRQKELFEDKREEEQDLQAQLLQEKANLNAYKVQLENKKAEKDRLLSVTQNDEQKYQELLAKARKELQSYSNYVASTGAGVIGANALGSGKGGWYYSQRDSRWAYDYIGNSGYTVYNSGCLVSSVAMLHKYYGKDLDPGELADEDQYFFYGDMLIPWPAPSGRDYKMLGYGYPKSKIEDELDDDNPVIVELTANNAAGTHFIVLIDEDGGDYKMHDPIYGPDLDFSDYYSTGQIRSAVAFK